MRAGGPLPPSMKTAWTLAALLLAPLLAGGCSGTFGAGAGGVDAAARFRRAEEALEAGRFERAARDLRLLAARCDSGARGREAVLMLAAVELDARNPDGFPPAGAQLAARYLQTPSIPAGSRRVAETLYLLALDLGAGPVDHPFGPVPRRDPGATREPRGRPGPGSSGYWTVAKRFERCGATSRAVEPRELPRHPGPPLWRVTEAAAEERDSLLAVADSLSRGLESLAEDAAARTGRLRARADSLEAELERVRELFRRGLRPAAEGADTTRPRRDSDDSPPGP